MCAAGCGEWYPRIVLEQRASWDDITRLPGGVDELGQRAQATSWPWGAALCPVCRNAMTPGHRGDVRYDVCRPHGVWLDSGELARFAQVFKLS